MKMCRFKYYVNKNTKISCVNIAQLQGKALSLYYQLTIKTNDMKISFNINSEIPQETKSAIEKAASEKGAKNVVCVQTGDGQGYENNFDCYEENPGEQGDEGGYLFSVDGTIIWER
jgi:hypothetical protein